MKRTAIAVLLVLPAWLLLASGMRAQAPAPAPLKLGIAGLVHGHVGGFLRLAQKRSDVQIVGIFEPDTAVQQEYAQRFGLPNTIFFTDLKTMLERTKPDA